jgi:hypothetical protein
MNLSRRDFLKLLGVTAAAAATPLPGIAAQPAESGIELAALLDAPVSKDVPFAWLELDGRRYGVEYLTLDVTAMKSSEGWMGGAAMCEIVADIYEASPALFDIRWNGREADVKMWVPGHKWPGVMGKGHITSMRVVDGMNGFLLHRVGIFVLRIMPV